MAVRQVVEVVLGQPAELCGGKPGRAGPPARGGGVPGRPGRGGFCAHVCSCRRTWVVMRAATHALATIVPVPGGDPWAPSTVPGAARSRSAGGSEPSDAFA